MLISDNLAYAKIPLILENAQTKLGQKINPTFYSSSEWTRKYKEGRGC